MNTLTYFPVNNNAATQEKIRQFLEESDSWKRLLDFIDAENDYLKIRLAHIYRLPVSEKIPGKKENLELDIQKTDQIISLNRSAVVSYEKWLTHQPTRTPGEIEGIFKRHIAVRKQIERVEINFAIQKVSFNDQLTENL